MKCFVTGASGFIGGNLVRQLVQQGHTVRVLVRSSSNLRGLEGLSGKDYETIRGDVLDKKSVEQGVAGCDWCFHAAASYHLWLADYRPMFQTNIDGTHNVLEAACATGCSRIVYTSTVGCVGITHETGLSEPPANESTDPFPQNLTNAYKRSKWLAELKAREFIKNGAPIVIVCPTAPIGPYDVKPTPTGKVILDFLKGEMPAYLETGLNWVHVRDVAQGHILAAEKGRIGERYILGNAEGNWMMKDTFTVLADITGLKAPKIKIPYKAALAAAYVNEAISHFTGKPPKAPIAGVKMAAYRMFFDPSKAIKELGLPQTPPRQALEDAIQWFRENGYTKK